MKTFSSILGLLLAITSTTLPVDAFAAKTQVLINVRAGTNGPRLRSEPVLCFADKDAGYVEITFRRNLGTASIEVTNSNGEVVDAATIDTYAGAFLTLTLSDPEDSYTVTIEAADYLGQGEIM